MQTLKDADISDIKFNEDGLVPCIAQDAKDGTILMLAWMNKESLQLTLETGRVTYWSRSRKKLWKKGEESGNFQVLHGIYKDCDMDAILVKIDQIGGAACHTGQRSCFYRQAQADGTWKEISKPLFDPSEVYKKK